MFFAGVKKDLFGGQDLQDFSQVFAALISIMD
jgi:hypothetical protein